MNPNPLAWAIFTDEGLIRIWSTAGTDVAAVAEATGKTPTPLYAAPVALSADRDRILAAAAFFFRMATGDEESECGEWDRHETTIDAARSGVTTAPPAQDELEAVQTIGYAWINRYNDGVDHVAPFPPTDGGVSFGEPLMAVEQHNRIVAALTRPAQTEQQPGAHRECRVIGFRPGMGEVTFYVEDGVPQWMNIGETIYVSDAAPIAQTAPQTGSPEGLSRQAAGGEA